MATGFFRKPLEKVQEAPPRAITPKAGRERLTTEEYWNQLSVPTADNVQPSVSIQGMWAAFSERSQARLVKQSIRNGDGKFSDTLHVVINPVKQ